MRGVGGREVYERGFQGTSHKSPLGGHCATEETDSGVSTTSGIYDLLTTEKQLSMFTTPALLKFL